MIKHFQCWKKDTWRTKDGTITSQKPEGAPEYTLSAKIGDKYVDIGAGWIKKGKDHTVGNYISFQLKDPWKDKAGFQIVEVAGDPKAVSGKDPVPGEKKTIDYPDENINLDDIPF